MTTSHEEKGGDAPVNLVDDNLSKGFFAMFCFDSFYLKRTVPVSKDVCCLSSFVAVCVHFRFPLESVEPSAL